MKKMVYGLFSVSFVLAISATNVNAQQSGYARSVSTNDLKSTRVEGRTISRSEAISTAQSDFAKKFNNASDVQWSTTGETMSVNFKNEGSKMRCTYNTSGALEYTLSYLKGSKIPGFIFNEVRRNDYYMDIVEVIEVKGRSRKTYFVRMEDKHSVVTVKVQNGNVEEHERFIKQ